MRTVSAILLLIAAILGLSHWSDVRAEASPAWRVVAAYAVAECFEQAESDADYAECPNGNAYEAWRELYVPIRDEVRGLSNVTLSCAVEFDALYVGAVRHDFTSDVHTSEAMLDELDLVEVSDLSQSSDGLIGCVYVAPAIP